MRPRPEHLTQILAKHADVGPLAATNPNLQVRRCEIDELEIVNGDGSCFPLQCLTRACVRVQRLAVALQGGIHRWYLIDGAAKLIQCSLDLPSLHIYCTGLQDIAFRVTCRRRYTQTYRRFIGLVGVEQVARKFRGLAKTQR